jgi:glycosyltransferase involved in cell wall biosynthesis
VFLPLTGQIQHFPMVGKVSNGWKNLCFVGNLVFMAGQVQLLMLEDVVREYAGHDLQVLARGLLLQHEDAERRATGILFRAADLFCKGEERVALFQLIEARRLLGFIPLPLMANVVWLALRTGDEQLAAHECLKFGGDAIEMGFSDLAYESFMAAYILDGMAAFEIIRSPELLKWTGELYERGAVLAGLLKEGKVPARRERRTTGRQRVAVVVPNLVDHVVAYTKRVLQFARYLDRERYELRVYVSENLSQRAAPLFPFGCMDGVTEKTGKETLAALRGAEVEVCMLPRDIPFSAAGRMLAERLDADEIDVAVFQSGMACPVDWLAMRCSRVPVKAGIHIGTSYYGAGLDVVFVDNPRNLEREGNWDEGRDGRRVVLRKGTDIDVLDSQQAIERGRLRIPAGAVIVGTLSNHLDKRLSEEYLTLIAQVMKAHPAMWFVPIGANTLLDKMQVFMRYGVAGRVRFAGRQLQVGSALKMLDVYASEFPVGGSQSVMEAMACGVPVVAMKWSEAHAESVAAEAAGTPYGIMQRDLGAYAKVLSHLVESGEARRVAGRSMRLRAEQYFSAGAYIAGIMRELERNLCASGS